MSVLTRAVAIAVMGLFALLALDVLVQGVQGALETAPSRTVAGDDGGVLAALVSTLLIALLALAISVPLALASAFLGAETLAFRPRTAALLRRSLDAATALPSVAVGLCGWMLFSNGLGLGFSLLAGAMTLSLMLAPLMASTFLAGIEATPPALRRQALALGVSPWHVFWHLVLPMCRPAIAAGIVLALGRATAETACLILTSGVSTRWANDIFDPGATLAVHVYHLARNVPDGEGRAYLAALLLVAVNAAIQIVLARLRLGANR